MVHQYYVDEITSISEQELRPLCRTVESPACLLGGWAVNMHVNDGFQEAYGRAYIGSRDVDLGFRPPTEPLLGHVFVDGAAQSLTEFRSWDVPAALRVVDADLLAAMKVRSIPDRDRGQKRVKDVADLHALLWHVRAYQGMRADVRSWVTDSDLANLEEHVDEQVYRDAAGLLQVDQQLVEDSIEQLVQ